MFFFSWLAFMCLFGFSVPFERLWTTESGLLPVFFDLLLFEINPFTPWGLLQHGVWSKTI